VVIGLGGIAEGYLPQLASLHVTGELPMKLLLLVDGDSFEDRNRSRQAFTEYGQKADVRERQARALYPGVPVQAVPLYVCRANVASLIPEYSVVLVSPDNHATRKLVGEHVGRLTECLLILGGNEAFNTEAGSDGTRGSAMVYWRKEGTDRTAPLLYHPEITEDQGPEPTELSCGELIAHGQLQVRRTNLMVGQAMLNLLLRYLQLPAEEATRVAEISVNSRTGSVVLYPRPPLDSAG
jgi:hypothetical protein